MSGVHIRWMIRRDMPAVLEIEELAFEYTWSESEFRRCLRQRNCIGMVAERDDRVVGFMIYELHKHHLHLLSLAVHSKHPREGIGGELLQKLYSKTYPDRRRFILTEVRETNLTAQKFFRRMGFRAVNVLRDFYEDTTEDAYQFRLKHNPLVSEIRDLYQFREEAAA